MHNGQPDGTCPVKIMNLPHDFVVAPFNNVAETRRIVESLPPDSLAAIVVEPVQGAAGCRPALPSFLSYLRATATDLGALFVVDEVMASRLAPSGTMAALGIKPDLLSLGKWIGGGMTFGAFGGRRDIMELFDPALGAKGVVHPGTYNNNVFTMSAGIVGLDIFSPAEVQRLNAMAGRMKAGIAAALLEHGIYIAEHRAWLEDPIEIDSFEADTGIYAGPGKDLLPLPKAFISGRGSMLNLRFTGRDASQWHSLYYHHMLASGIYLASRGYTPLNIMLTEEDIDTFVDAVQAFLKEHANELTK